MIQKTCRSKKLLVVLALCLIFSSVPLITNAQAPGLLAYDISHQGIHPFVCYGNPYDAQMNISGYIIISADRKSITVYYDLETLHTNSFYGYIRAYANNSIISQMPFATQNYFIPGYPGWEVNPNYVQNPSGSVTFTYSTPFDRVEVGYNMQLKPDVYSSHIWICDQVYAEFIIP